MVLFEMTIADYVQWIFYGLWQYGLWQYEDWLGKGVKRGWQDQAGDLLCKNIYMYVCMYISVYIHITSFIYR